MYTNTERQGLLDDNMSDDVGLLNDYDQEYQQLSGQISRAISQIKSANAKQTNKIITDAADDMESLKMCIRSMKHEVNSIPTNIQQKWREKIELYDNDYKQLRNDFERATNNANRNTLLVGANDPNNIGLNSDRQRLIGMNVIERNNTDTLKETMKQLNDTEQIADDTMVELHNQRSVIEKIKKKLGSGNVLLGRMGRTITRMNRRQAMMRLLWCFVILVLITIIALIIYFKVKPKKDNNQQ